MAGDTEAPSFETIGARLSRDRRSNGELDLRLPMGSTDEWDPEAMTAELLYPSELF
jgi:hypothetical protein